MAENIKLEDIVNAPTSEATEQAETDVEVETETVVEAEQDPLKTELDKVQKQGRTEKEKAEFSLRKTAERVKELGGDPTDILGIKVEEKVEDDDDRPVTRAELNRIISKGLPKTALQMADDIQDKTERELVKYHLENTIKPQGDAHEDLKLARIQVNSLKNTQIVQEINRKGTAKTHSNNSGVDAKQEHEVVYSTEEQSMMRAPFNLSPKEILDARNGKSIKFKK